MFNPIILLERLQKKDLKPSKHIDCMCHNIPGDSTSGKYIIKMPIFDSGFLEEWIIFAELVQKVLIGQNVTTGPPIYKCMERELNGGAKAKSTQQAYLEGICTVGNCT